MFYLALFYLASMHIFICVLNMYAYVKVLLKFKNV